MPRLSATARRLFLAFAALVAIFALASAAAMRALDELHETLHQVKEREADVRAVLELSQAVRDQYAHQAHMIILGDASHAEMYDDAQKRVATLTAGLRNRLSTPAQVVGIGEIETTSRSIDTRFRKRLLPAVLAHDEETIKSEHNELLMAVSRVEGVADRLVEEAEEQIGTFEDHAAAIEHVALRWTFALLVLSTLLAVAVGLYIGRSVTRPLAILEAGAARIGRGDLRSRIELETKDEFGRLAAQMNAMTQALSDHQDKLVESEKLASIGRLAAGVAHEINNPLAVILGYTKLLARKADGPLGEDLAVIQDEALRCQEIVEGLLDLARPIRVDDTRVDLKALCDDVIARLHDSEALREVEVRVRGAGVVTGSEPRLRQVVHNLVRNAVEAAPPGSSVDVRIAHGTEGVDLSVIDSGPGVSEENRSRLFEPFFTTRASGTGLGLALSRTIARTHGGDVLHENRPEGGAVFTLHLPSLTEMES